MSQSSDNVDTSLPKEIEFIYSETMPLFESLRPLLVSLVDNEERINLLLKELTPYGKEFIAFVNTFRKTEDPLNLESSIRLYGGMPSFDLLITMKFSETLTGEAFKWDGETSKPKVLPSDLIPYAIEARDSFDNGSRHQHNAFITGLTFDVLRELNEKLGVNKKKTENLIRSQFEAGMKLTAVGVAKGKTVEGLSLDTFIVSTILLKRAGRIVLSILNESYDALGGLIEKNSFRSPYGHLAENQIYGVSNNIISCALARFTPGLSPVGAALLFYDYPHLLWDKTQRDTYELVDLCSTLSL